MCCSLATVTACCGRSRKRGGRAVRGMRGSFGPDTDRGFSRRYASRGGGGRLLEFGGGMHSSLSGYRRTLAGITANGAADAIAKAYVDESVRADIAPPRRASLVEYSMDIAPRPNAQGGRAYPGVWGAHALPACPHVPLPRRSHMSDALHRCVAYLTEHGVYDSWTPRSERRALALPSSCTA